MTLCVYCTNEKPHPEQHWCQQAGPQKAAAWVEAFVRETKPADRIRARIAEKRAEYENFKAYLAMRTREEDLHGIWDAGVNMSEVSSYIDGLQFALQALGEKEER